MNLILLFLLLTRRTGHGEIDKPGIFLQKLFVEYRQPFDFIRLAVMMQQVAGVMIEERKRP